MQLYIQQTAVVDELNELYRKINSKTLLYQLWQTNTYISTLLARGKVCHRTLECWSKLTVQFQRFRLTPQLGISNPQTLDQNNHINGTIHTIAATWVRGMQQPGLDMVVMRVAFLQYRNCDFRHETKLYLESEKLR